MSYKVHFVGLVCFYRESAGRHALLPDGRNPGGSIAPHYPTLIVDPEAVEASAGWPPDDRIARGVYELPDCTVALEAMDTSGTLDTSGHDNLLPQLRQIDPNFEIDLATAQTVARLHIRQGTLTVHQVPGGSALVSQLVVPHGGSIDVVVTPRDGSAVRTLRLAAGTEIIVGNMSKHGIYDGSAPVDDHFQIYAKLTSQPVSLVEPTSVAAVGPLSTGHWMFTRAATINLSISCTNTGCC